MDSGVVQVLHDAFKAALFSPANTAARGRFDMPEQYLEGEGYADFIARHAEYERAMVQRLGLKLDRSAGDPGWTWDAPCGGPETRHMRTSRPT